MLETYLSLAVKAIFVENMALAFFLGMCSFIAVSRKVATALGLGAAVILVLSVPVPMNNVISRYGLCCKDSISFIVFFGKSTNNIGFIFAVHKEFSPGRHKKIIINNIDSVCSV